MAWNNQLNLTMHFTKKMHKHRTDSNIIRYKTYRNKLINLFRLAEKQHYQILLEQNKNNSKKNMVNSHGSD